MPYVEWLRVRGALKWIAIVLAAFFVLTAICRVWAFGFGGDAIAHIARMEADPSSHVTVSTAPDGARRTVIEDTRERVHVVIDDYGWGRKHIEILDRSSRDHSKETVVAGNVRVRTLPSGGGSLVVIDSNGIPFTALAIVGVIVALVFATVVGSPFARENDGHLEIAMTKPIGRTALGLTTIAMDAAGIVAAFALGVASRSCASRCSNFRALPTIRATSSRCCLGIVAPLSWYALLNAATASMKRGYGAVVGFAWPVALLIFGLSRIRPDGNAMLMIVSGVFKWLAFLDPVSYMHLSSGADAGGTALTLPIQINVLILALLAAVYCSLAVVQWRRIES